MPQNRRSPKYPARCTPLMRLLAGWAFKCLDSGSTAQAITKQETRFPVFTLIFQCVNQTAFNCQLPRIEFAGQCVRM